MRCSYAVPEGRACASHFDVVNPLDKQGITSMGDETIPEHYRGRSVCPNIASPKIIEPSGKDDDKNMPKHVMYGIEAMWIYKHAWRGAGLYYRSGDHQVPKSETTNKPTSMYKALSMYPVWDKWLMPRCEPIAERFYNDPMKWSLSAYDDEDSFGELPPLGYARFEYRIAEELDFNEGNLFRIWYNLLRPDERTFWHTFMMKAQQKIEYRWDDFLADKKAGKIAEGEPYDPVVNFDPRFHYYDKYVDIVGFLPEVSSRKEEEEKCTIWELEEQDLELFMAMDPESFAAKAMNPKKRKPDPETEGEGVSRHPTAKRKPEGAIETPMASASASPSASQEPPTAEMETPSESHSTSASGVLEPPRARPTHTPKTPGDGTDGERQEEVLVAATALENELDDLPLDIVTPEEQLITGFPKRDIETLVYHLYPEKVAAREYIDPIIRKFMSSLSPDDSTEREDQLMREFIPTCFNDTYDKPHGSNGSA